MQNMALQKETTSSCPFPRDTAERTKTVENRKILQEKISRTKIIQAKQSSFRSFLQELEILDLRKDGIQAHQFVSKLSK